MTSSSASGPNLDFYRKQAKQLVRAVRAGDGRAFERVRPQLRHFVSLADAQLVIAREQGFESWAVFQESVAGSAREPAARGVALAELVDLLQGDAFAAARRACEQLHLALGRDDASGAAHCACGMQAALAQLKKGHAVDAEGRASAEPVLAPEIVERASRAYDLLERVIRDEALDMAAIRCSFCLKGHREVARLVRGQQGYICDACTSVAADILQRHAG